MGKIEFIIALTQHRYLGNVFMPYIIREKEKFYSVETIVKSCDFNTIDYKFRPYEKELVKIIEKYSERNLMKKFSRAEKVTEFFADLESDYYGTILNDAGMFSKIKLFYLILDESQYVKNPSSKTYKAIMRLSASHRLVLTGTPIENSLSDLWAQMNFLNRGMLGNLAFFRRYFITPIEKHSNEDQQEKLQILIRPFILRRTKEQVAKDLPPLMEQVLICDMEEKIQLLQNKKSSLSDRFINSNNPLQEISKEEIMSLFK